MRPLPSRFVTHAVLAAALSLSLLAGCPPRPTSTPPPATPAEPTPPDGPVEPPPEVPIPTPVPGPPDTPPL
ncbi:MAG: hypothetical protein V4850_03580 [Myxococcota bacterium]